jgi:hypothetical protein
MPSVTPRQVPDERESMRADIRDCVAKVGELLDKPGYPPIQTLNWLRSLCSRYDDTPQSNGQPTLPAIQDAAEFTRSELKPPTELVAGILHKGCKLALGGGSKTFKTWALIDLALSVSHGQPWLGFKTTCSKVAYLNFELPDWSIHSRLKSVAYSKQIIITPGWLHVWNLRGQAADYKDLLPRLSNEISIDKLGLIILDPIYKLYGKADENSARDISGLLNEFERLARDTGAAIAFAAHFAKGNAASKESIDRISGSGVFARDPDSIVTFTRHEEEDAFTVDATLRNHATVKPFVVQWEFPLMERNDELDPVDIKRRQTGRAKEFTVAMLIEALGKRKMASGEFQKHCESQNGMSRPTFYALLKKAGEAGSLIRDNGKWRVKPATV